MNHVHGKDKESGHTWRWKLSKRSARSSIWAFIWSSSGITAGMFCSSLMRRAIRAATLQICTCSCCNWEL